MDERCHTIIEHIKRLAQYQWSGEFHGLKDTGKLATREELEKCLAGAEAQKQEYAQLRWPLSDGPDIYVTAVAKENRPA